MDLANGTGHHEKKIKTVAFEAFDEISVKGPLLRVVRGITIVI